MTNKIENTVDNTGTVVEFENGEFGEVTLMEADERAEVGDEKCSETQLYVKCGKCGVLMDYDGDDTYKCPLCSQEASEGDALSYLEETMQDAYNDLLD